MTRPTTKIRTTTISTKLVVQEIFLHDTGERHVKGRWAQVGTWKCRHIYVRHDVWRTLQGRPNPPTLVLEVLDLRDEILRASLSGDVGPLTVTRRSERRHIGGPSSMATAQVQWWDLGGVVGIGGIPPSDP